MHLSVSSNRCWTLSLFCLKTHLGVKLCDLVSEVPRSLEAIDQLLVALFAAMLYARGGGTRGRAARGALRYLVTEWDVGFGGRGGGVRCSFTLTCAFPLASASGRRKEDILGETMKQVAVAMAI